MALTWQQHQQNIFGGESGGDYDALFGYQNRPNGVFQGVKVSDMPIADVINFTSPSGEYGQYVKGKVGRVATPVGAYQVVGSTLRAAVDALGIDPSQKFDKETQDKIGQWILKTQGTGAWEGYGKGGAAMAQQPAQMMQEEKPQGLLGGLLGGQGLGQKLGMSQDFTDKLAMAIMAGTGDARLTPLIQQRAASMQERKATRDVNKTVDWLRDNGYGEIARAVEANPQSAANVMSAVLSQRMTPSKSGKVVTAEQLRTMFPGEQIADGLYNLSEGPDGLKISKVGGAGSQTTIQMPGERPAEDKLREELMKRQGKDFGSYLDAGSSASQAMTDLRILQELAPLAPSGPLAGRLAETFPEFNDVATLRQSIVNRVGPSLRVEGSGSTSDIEFNAMINSLGSLRNAPEANQAIIAVMTEKQQFNLDRANIVRQYQTGKIDLNTANNQIAALESQSRIPAAVEQILSQYRGDNTGPTTSAPKIRTYNPETGEFE